MKKTLAVFLTVVMLMLSISIIPTSVSCAASVPTADWGGSNGSGFYLKIQPVKGVSNYRVFIKYSAWNSRDNKPYSKWVKVKDFRTSSKTTVFVTLPSAIKAKKKLNIRYTVRGMNSQYTKYTTGFINDSSDLIRWSSYYDYQKVSKKNGEIHLTMTPDGRFENPTSKWSVFVKNKKGNWVSIPYEYESQTSLDRLIIPKRIVNTYKVNGKLTFAARLRADVGNTKSVWYWCGGYKAYSMKV